MSNSITAIKNFLKRFLPPSVHTFNREIERILEAIGQQQQELARQAQVLTAQGEQLAELAGALEAERVLAARSEESFKTLWETRHAEFLSRLTALDERQAAAATAAASGFAAFSQATEHLMEAVQGKDEVLQQVQSLQRAIEVAALENRKSLTQLPQIKGQLQAIRNETLRLLPQPRLTYFVLNILDHCNLRCKGCDHFACIAEERYVSLHDIQRDVLRMSELTQGAVTRIGVMGGEPLLHPDLLEILAATRAAFPNTLIQLVTNGLLLLKQSEAFWKCCYENDITIVNTKYPIHLDHERMQQVAAEHKVKFEFYGNTEEVQKTSYKMPMDIDGRQDPRMSFLACYHANSLPLLMEGKFYACTVAPNIIHFNKKFGTSMALENKDYIDIYKVTSAEEIFAFLATPKPFCRYCIPDKRSFGHKWERSKQQRSEWTLEE